MEENLIEIEKKNLIGRKKFNSAQLMGDFPPKIYNNNKKIVFGIACPPDCNHSGDLVFSRWSQINWPEEAYSPTKNSTRHVMEENIYHYTPSNFALSNTLEWHVNFADKRLFGYYGGPLFAQDEMQVAEHPILGAVRECMSSLEVEDSRFGPYTRDVDSIPTPILIRGVERRVEISVNPSYESPFGLYGREFSSASENAIRTATKALIPPSISNIIAMEAPKYGKGSYSLKVIQDVFNTAYTAFLAARIESYHHVSDVPHVIVHTGNWGTGAYGGNKTLMAILQILSARVAGIDTLVYHTFQAESSKKYEEALTILNTDLIPDDQEVQIINILFKIEKMKFNWGVSDGN